MRKFNPHSLAAQNQIDGVVDDAIYIENLPSLTVQSEADNCDINRIMSHFEKTGSIEHLANVPVRYGDVSGVTDYKTMLDYTKSVQSEFNALPPDVRSMFNNDAGQMLDYLLNPANEKDALARGFLVKPKGSAAEVAATSQTQAAEPAEGTSAPHKVL